MKNILVVVLTILIGQQGIAQLDSTLCNCASSEVVDIVPLPPLREADVMWSTTVYRDLDLRQKINHPYYFPVKPSDGYQSLFDLMTSEVLSGCMHAYAPTVMSPTGEFSSQMTCGQMQAMLSVGDSILTYDIASDEDIWVSSTEKIESAQVTRYRIKETWVFDKQRSRMIARTTGIAPMVEVRGEDGSMRGYKILFWIHYPESRTILARHPVFVRHNDNRALNYDDLFAKRYYDGFIVKESNVYDRGIWEYAQGVDALLEGEKIEERIRNMESDFWSY